MSRATSDESGHHPLPKPIIKKMRWPFPFIWLVPALAAALAGYYFYGRAQDKGPLITVKFDDATGLKDGESKVIHLGVAIGQVVDSELSPDQKEVLVHVQLKREDSSFAKQGAAFWIVRPEISTQEISGLATVISGPLIGANPGDGQTQTEFTGLKTPPVTLEDGLRIVMKAPRSQRLQSNSPVYFRDLQVGVVESVNLSPDATEVEAHVFIHRAFSTLVKTNSQFWVVAAVDFKGGLFTGVQMKVESLQSLLSGGIGFATPQDDMGDQAVNGSEFVLHDESKKDWLEWAPKIPIGSTDSTAPDANASLLKRPQANHSNAATP